MKLRVVVGSEGQHVVEVAYSRSLRLLRILIDGQSVYRDCRLLPWAARGGVEIKTAGPEVHTLVVEPPRGRFRSPDDADNYLVWLDGQPVARVDVT